MTQSLDRYESFDFLHGSWTRRVYKRGTGPAVIIIHEIPGLNPLVVRFADRVADAGMTVYLPSLFGEPDIHRLWIDPLLLQRVEGRAKAGHLLKREEAFVLVVGLADGGRFAGIARNDLASNRETEDRRKVAHDCH